MDSTMTTIRITRDSDNIATVWIDVPGKSVNTITPQVLSDLGTALTQLAQDPQPAGVIFASAKKAGFVAGADLFEIRKMDRDQVTAFLSEGQKVFGRIAALPMPTAAAINGDCLGGGYELALACTYRVAADDGSINIGLPETKLGILPAWGGTTRLPRTIGLAKALPLLLAGKTLPPKKAMKIGMIDEVVRAEVLPAACKRLLVSHADRHAADWKERLAAATPFLRNRILATAESQTKQKTYGHYPAPLKLIAAIRTGFEQSIDAGLKAEIDALVELMDGETCRNLMRLFFLRQGAKRALAQRIQAKPKPIKYAAVIGGGVMGAGIVHAMIKADIEVRLIEVDAKALSAGLGRIKSLLDEDVATGRMSALDAKHAMHRVAPTIEWTGLELMDVVIEAVVEKLDVKRQVFAKLDRMTRSDCVLATNTSSLLVSDMADAVQRPQRLVGIHFFNPVAKMPLVEVVRTSKSDDQSLATAIGLCAAIGKTPILVNDAPGFLVNRVLIPYLAEALAAAADGIPVPVIDAALRSWGMPMGPLELLDEIGLDVGHHVLTCLSDSLGGQLPPLPPAIDQAIAKGWLGKKSGRGFYIYAKDDHKQKQADLNAEMVALLSPNPPAPDASAPAVDNAEREKEIQWRLVLPMVNEAAKLLAEGVTDSTDVIDLSTVLGTGLAPFRGGLAQFADTTGIDVIVTKLAEMSAKYGPRFAPAPMLRELAASHHPLRDFAVAGAVATRPSEAPWRKESVAS
jgi:3-hydroxyacyl-CoA dehydrogenase/enoyl-CoA hydratase/3-hydroxybutyryl-CoA epimerase